MAGHAGHHVGTTRRHGRAFDDEWLRSLGVPERELRRAATVLLVIGVLSLIAGALAIVVPAAASVAMSIFTGWLLAFAGVLMGVYAFSRHARRARDHRAVLVLSAALTLLVGLYLLIFPLSGAITLTFLLAVWFFGIGALELIGAWRARDLPGVGLIALHGAVSLILGLLIALSLPSSAAWAIGLLVGVNLIFWGVRTLVLGTALRRLTAAA
jgi:uncharacterized membrane protein HdeD (DUF308 family)